MNLPVVAQHALRADDGEGADRDVVAQAGRGVDDGGGVDLIRHGLNEVKVVSVVKEETAVKEKI